MSERSGWVRPWCALECVNAMARLMVDGTLVSVRRAECTLDCPPLPSTALTLADVRSTSHWHVARTATALAAPWGNQPVFDWGHWGGPGPFCGAGGSRQIGAWGAGDLRCARSKLRRGRIGESTTQRTASGKPEPDATDSEAETAGGGLASRRLAFQQRH